MTLSEHAWVCLRTSFLINIPGQDLRQNPFSIDLPESKHVPGGDWLGLLRASPQVLPVYFT